MYLTMAKTISTEIYEGQQNLSSKSLQGMIANKNTSHIKRL